MYVLVFALLLLICIIFSFINAAIVISRAQIEIYDILSFEWETYNTVIERIQKSENGNIQSALNSFAIRFLLFLNFHFVKKEDARIPIGMAMLDTLVDRGAAEKTEKSIGSNFISKLKEMPKEEMEKENAEKLEELVGELESLFSQIEVAHIRKKPGGRPKKKINLKSAINLGRQPVFN